MDQNDERYPLLISTGSTRYHLICQLVSRDKSFETFRIYPEKTQDKFIELTGNRPLLRARGLKKKAIHWDVKGMIRNQYTVTQAIKQIEAYLEPKLEKKRNIPTTQAPAYNRKKGGAAGPPLGDVKH